MKRNTLLIVLAIISLRLQSQTYDIEKAYINDLLKKSSENTGLVTRYYALLKKGLYPQLPYDTSTKKVEWKKVLSFEGMTKKQIMNRVKEWSARNYRSFDAVREYEDDESGKFMIKGYFNLPLSFKYSLLFFKGESSTAIKCHSILVFTIIEGGLKIEVVRPENEITNGGYTIGNTYVPITTTRAEMISYFPIVRMPENLWEGYMEFYRDMNAEYLSIFISIEKYVSDYKNDYNFGK